MMSCVMYLALVTIVKLSSAVYFNLLLSEFRGYDSCTLKKKLTYTGNCGAILSQLLIVMYFNF